MASIKLLTTSAQSPSWYWAAAALCVTSQAHYLNHRSNFCVVDGHIAPSCVCAFWKSDSASWNLGQPGQGSGHKAERMGPGVLLHPRLF